MANESTIDVLSGGMLTSLQDLGRCGYQKYGVIAGGAMDTYALRLANLLVGNAPAEAALEITFQGPVLNLAAGMMIAFMGAEASPHIAGQTLPLNRPIYIKKNCQLDFGSCHHGCRAYMAVAGGFDVPLVMGSKSTYLRAGIGGFKGRALHGGDRLKVGIMSDQAVRLAKQLKSGGSEYFSAPGWYVPWQPYFAQGPIRLTLGTQFEWFTKESQQQLFSSVYEISSESDRMGYRLAGDLLLRAKVDEMISEALTFGSIQVANSGSPILLMADRQTTGGYPRIAQAALVDLPRLAQMPAGSLVRFEQISLPEAEQLYVRREKYIDTMTRAIRFYSEREI